jgi:hypothetical protein
MPRLTTTHKPSGDPRGGARAPNFYETAAYTHDLLKSLERLAADQGQTRLVQLIAAAAAEAQTVAGPKTL